MQEINNAFLRAMKIWLKELNPLTDCSYAYEGGRNKFRDTEVAAFRNNPTLAYVERESDYGRAYHLFRSHMSPNHTQLLAHLVNQWDKTIWMINGGSDRLLMLVDIDNKNGVADVDGAADYILHHYLGGHGIIQPSTGGWGRHVYFVMDVEFISRREIRNGLAAYSAIIKKDQLLSSLGVSFDSVFYGLPTLWQGEKGSEAIESRGNDLRIPYMPHGMDSLNEFKSLKPLPYSALSSFLSSRSTSDSSVSNPLYTLSRDRCDMPFQRKNAGQRWNTDHPDGKIRKTSCVSHNLIKHNGNTTPDHILNDYHEHYNPTGMTPRDINRRLKSITWLFDRFMKAFRARSGSHPDARPFRKDQHLDLVAKIVPESSYGRPEGCMQRDKITPEKLSDFVSLKVQDAFYVKDDIHWFAAASRNATIACSKTMKAKGLINWTINNHTHKRLLDIAVNHGLLEVFEPHVPPSIGTQGMKIKLVRGKARVIGPGKALAAEREAWLRLYSERKAIIMPVLQLVA